MILCSLYIHHYVIKIYILYKKMSVFSNHWQSPPLYSAAPSSIDGSYCISWKATLKAEVKRNTDSSTCFSKLRIKYFTIISPCLSALCSPPWAGCTSAVDQTAPCVELQRLRALDKLQGEALWNCAGSSGQYALMKKCSVTFGVDTNQQQWLVSLWTTLTFVHCTERVQDAENTWTH